MIQVVLYNVTNGLIIGAFYVLMALGLSLILNLSNVINFAHGNFLALGGYLAFTLSPVLGYWGALVISRADRRRCRTAHDPPDLQSRPGLQSTAHVRARVRAARWRALYLGSKRLADGTSG